MSDPAFLANPIRSRTAIAGESEGYIFVGKKWNHRQNDQKPFRLIPVQIGLLALFFLAYHFFLFYIMRETALNLGAVRFKRHIVPLYAEPSFDLSLWIIPALLVCAGFLYLCHKFLLSGISAKRLIWIAFVCFFAISISVALIDGYREYEEEGEAKRVLALLEPYTRTSLEYYGDVPRVDELGLRTFLRDYSKPELFEKLSGHARTHPPRVGFFMLFSKIIGSTTLYRHH